MLSKNIFSRFVLGCAFLTTFHQANAGVGTSLMQTARVEAPGSFELKLQNDFVFNRGGGINISPHLKTGIVENFLDIDTFFGAGKTDFQIGTKIKYNLLPDLDGQVGVGFYAGYSFLRDDVNKAHGNFHLFSLGAIVSKRFEVDFGFIEPYGAFETEFLFFKGDSEMPLTLLFGAKWEPSATAQWGFYSEVGISLKDSFNTLALGASYPF